MNDHRITKGLPGVIFSLTQLPSLPTPKVKAKNNKIPPPPNIGVGSFFPSPVGLPFSSLGIPDSSVGKESACNAGNLSLTLGLGRSPGEEKGYPLQDSSLENFMDCIVHGVTKSQT